MNPLDYTFASTNLRVVHARNETLLNILLKQNPNSTKIKPLEDCLRRLNTCSVYFYQVQTELAETLVKQRDIFIELQKHKLDIGVKDKKIKKLEQQLSELKKNIEYER